MAEQRPYLRAAVKVQHHAYKCASSAKRNTIVMEAKVGGEEYRRKLEHMRKEKLEVGSKVAFPRRIQIAKINSDMGENHRTIYVDVCCRNATGFGISSMEWRSITKWKA